MDFIKAFLTLIGVTCTCIVVLMLLSDTFALRIAAMLKARVEARTAYRQAFQNAYRRLQQEYGLDERR